MNFRGIALMRGCGMQAPKAEEVFWSMPELLGNLDKNELYEEADLGATILVFDRNEKVNQHSLWEKGVRKYKVQPDKFNDILCMKIDEILTKNKRVKFSDLAFITHQTYNPDTIAYSGRVGMDVNEDGFGMLQVELVKGLRKGKRDFDGDMRFVYPVVGFKVYKTQAELAPVGFEKRKEVPLRLSTLRACGNFIDNSLDRVVSDVATFERNIRKHIWTPANPNVDFEVYTSDVEPDVSKRLFYHDAFLACKGDFEETLDNLYIH